MLSGGVCRRGLPCLASTLHSARTPRSGLDSASTVSRRHQASTAQRKSDRSSPSLTQAMRVLPTNMLRVVWDDRVASQYHYIWLRDNCQCSSCLDPTTFNRLQDTASMSLDIHPKDITFSGSDGTVGVSWSDGHESVYPKNWLRNHAGPFLVDGHSTYSSESVKSKKAMRIGEHVLEGVPDPLPWRADMLHRADIFVSYADLNSQDPDVSQKALLKLCRNIRLYGLAFLRGVPTEDRKVLEVAKSISIPKETCYGYRWDVVQEASPTVSHPAYSGAELDLHTDLNYREKSPGLQFLHCTQLDWVKSPADIPASQRGLSMFVDGLAVANHLRENNPAAYHILSSTPVTFSIRFKEHTYTHEIPILCVGSNDELEEIHINNRSMAPLQLEPKMIRPFYSAYQSLNECMRDDKFRFTHQLQPGELVIFNNRRVMHGRTAYDPTSVSRKLSGCYSDLDEFMSKYRSLLFPAQSSS